MLPELEKFTFSWTLPLRWSDIDELRHVNNAKYLTFFEDARINYSRAVSEWDWTTEGFLVAAAHINYRRPLFLRDEPTVYVRTSKIGTKSFDMEYIIVSKTGELIADGTTVQVCIDMTTFKPVAMPAHHRERTIAYEKVI